MKEYVLRHKKLIGAAVAVIACGFLPVFVSSPYYLDLFITSMVNTVLAIAFVMMLRAGLINLGLVAYWGVGAYFSAIMVMKFHLSFWLSLPAAALFSGLVALGLGFILIGRGNGGLSFAILSAVIGMLFPVTVGTWNYLGGYNGIPNIPGPNPIHLPFLPAVDFVSKVQFFYLGLVLFVVVLLTAGAFYAASTGRAWTAVGQSPRLAESIGIDLFRYKLLATVVAAVILGLMGSFYAHYETFLTPDSFGMWENIYVQMYAILGGLSFPILGPLVGAIVMTLLPEVLRIDTSIAQIMNGGILILLVLFLPRGLLGTLEWVAAAKDRVVRSIKGVNRYAA